MWWGFFFKSQLLMCWTVAISCKAYEVDGMGTVLFLITLGTESSISLQPGTGAEALQANSEKSNSFSEKSYIYEVW